MNETKNYIKKVFSFYTVIFYILALYVAYIMGMEATTLAQDPRNPRNQEVLLRRGRILTRTGKPLAMSKETKEGIRRLYPMGAATAPLVGYLDPVYGKSGLEEFLDRHLRAPTTSTDILEYLFRYSPRGEDVFLTIDEDVQKKAWEVLKGSKGAVVAMNPANGEILALASSPGYLPEKLGQNWGKIRKDKDAPLLLRPVNGSYPPGSVFKLFTYAAALQEGVVEPGTVFSCRGDYPIQYELGTYHITESGGAVHGTQTCVDAVANSCNIAFAQIGLRLGRDKFYEYAQKFGLTEKPDFMLITNFAPFPPISRLTETQLAQSAFGQGQITLSPLQVALMASAFASDGRIYEPVIVKARADEKGKVIFRASPVVWKNPVNPDTARKVREAMIEVVRRGTGTRAQIEGVEVAGKTGSAENPFGDTHAWFAGFAPAGNPRILVVVVVENAGGGGRAAAPLAREVIMEALKKERTQGRNGRAGREAQPIPGSGQGER
jgi:peptidoglycan glycosyltransferase